MGFWGGGLTAEERARREQVRLAAAELPGGGPVTGRWPAVPGVADAGEPVAAGARCWWPGGAGPVPVGGLPVHGDRRGPLGPAGGSPQCREHGRAGQCPRGGPHRSSGSHPRSPLLSSPDSRRLWCLRPCRRHRRGRPGRSRLSRSRSATSRTRPPVTARRRGSARRPPPRPRRRRAANGLRTAPDPAPDHQRRRAGDDHDLQGRGQPVGDTGGQRDAGVLATRLPAAPSASHHRGARIMATAPQTSCAAATTTKNARFCVLSRPTVAAAAMLMAPAAMLARAIADRTRAGFRSGSPRAARHIRRWRGLGQFPSHLCGHVWPSLFSLLDTASTCTTGPKASGIPRCCHRSQVAVRATRIRAGLRA